MTYIYNSFNKQKIVDISKKRNIRFSVHGQGIFMFSTKNKNNASFFIYNEKYTDGFHIEFTKTCVNVKHITSGKYLVDNYSTGLVDNKNAYYWFSLDAQNTRLMAGCGEARVENKTYIYQLDYKYRDELESLYKIKLDSDNINPMKCIRDPVRSVIPLFVKNTNELTMEDIATNKYLPHSDLSTVGQQLYECVSGKKFVLNTPDFPDFTSAIEYSIHTPGCFCYNRLKEKSTEFNPDKPNINETYLRITLGENNGESPGIPYVMEIWPVGHYSPVHNHSAANAIIRVLHGSINVNLYPFLGDNVKPFGNVDFNKEDVTWISANLNQVHKLENLPTNVDTCITIQCYMYDKTDNVHYDYFDYISEKGTIEHYNPDSDMDYMSFKAQIKQEWDAYLSTVRRGIKRKRSKN
jgi:hypothetical protein